MHVNTGGLFKGGHGFFKAHHVSVGKGAVYGNNGAFKLAVESALQKTAGDNGEGGLGRRFFLRYRRLPFDTSRPGSVNFRQHCIQVGRAAHVVSHPGPERARAYLAGHQVRAVEAEAGGASHQFSQIAL